MNRRNFIRIVGVGMGATALSSSLVGCSLDSKDTAYGWNGPNAAETDIRMRVLSYAMLCPNPHNKQPWLIKLTGPEQFELYVDPERLLPETDPIHRQIHIGQGTFLETLAIAATGLGYKADIRYFPQGMYSNTTLTNKPVASITLIQNPTGNTDPLFSKLLHRHTNKREYDNQPLPSTALEALQHFHSTRSKHALTINQVASDKTDLARMLTQAMQIEVGDKARDMETIKMFRFNSDEVAKYRDGFGIAQSGVTGMKKALIENFILSRKSTEQDPTAFGQQAVDLTQNAANSTACFAWLTTQGNSRLDQVQVGRDYCRINLKTSEMGLAQHPMSQVLQEYEDMLSLQRQFKTRFHIDTGDTVQMLFRIGRAEATPHSPRRPVSDLITG